MAKSAVRNDRQIAASVRANGEAADELPEGRPGDDECGRSVTAAERPDHTDSDSDDELADSDGLAIGKHDDDDVDDCDGGTGEAADDATDNASVRAGPRWTVRVKALVAILGVAAIALGVATALLGQQWLEGRSVDDARGAALAAARSAATNLTTINHQTVEKDLKRLSSSGTDQFSASFAQNSDSYVKAVKESQIVTDGKILRSGVSKMSEGKGTVLVVVETTVKNKEVPKGEKRSYRMSIDVEQQPDGGWLASRLEFVQ